MNNENFTSRIFHYISGELHLVEKQFDRLEDAIEAGVKAAAHSFKVYDMNGECHYDSHGHNHGPYC